MPPELTPSQIALVMSATQLKKPATKATTNNITQFEAYAPAWDADVLKFIDVEQDPVRDPLEEWTPYPPQSSPAGRFAQLLRSIFLLGEHSGAEREVQLRAVKSIAANTRSQSLREVALEALFSLELQDRKRSFNDEDDCVVEPGAATAWKGPRFYCLGFRDPQMRELAFSVAQREQRKKQQKGKQ